jgi:uncharacterized damage-inducible protein DinB
MREISPALLAGQLQYSEWASRKLLEYALTLPEERTSTPIPNSHGGILKTFQHTYYADRVWFCRVLDPPVPQVFEDPAPGPSLKELDERWWKLLDNFIATVKARDPHSVISYKNLKGEAYSRELWQIVLHLANHGTYHRGQIASMMRQLGFQPPSTDLIYYYAGL